MKLIVISTPYFFEGEAALIWLLMEAGLELFHLRKPGTSLNKTRRLLNAIPSYYHDRIVLHDAFHLCDTFQLKGIHLNSRNKVVPEGFSGSVSRSCHSLEEVKQAVGFDYVFLSPIFDSISKKEYRGRFAPEALQEAGQNGIIHSGVIALGGMNVDTIPQMASFGFGGVAVLGALWGNNPSCSNSKELLRRFEQLQLSVTK